MRAPDSYMVRPRQFRADRERYGSPQRFEDSVLDGVICACHGFARQLLMKWMNTLPAYHVGPRVLRLDSL
jgi:hypothetical protein